MSEQADIDLLDTVLFKFAYTEDKDLEDTIDKFLVPILDKFDSPHATTKQKVLQVLTHINKRVKTQSNIKLPLLKLATQFLESGPIQQNFLMTYLTMGFERDLVETKKKVVALLLSRVATLPPEHVGSVFSMFLSIVGDIKIPVYLEKPEKLEIPDDFRFCEDRESKKLVLEWLTDFLLLTPSAWQDTTPSGLSPELVQKILKPIKDKPAKIFLSTTKLNIVYFFKQLDHYPTIFTHNEMFLPLMVASCDPNSQISDAGASALKVLRDKNLEEKQILEKLFGLFLGTVQKNVTEDKKRLPVSHVMRVKILDYLCQSKTAANFFPSTLQLIFECFYGNTTSNKLKEVSMRFVDWVFKLADKAQLKLMGPLILKNGLLKLMEQTNAEDDPLYSTSLKNSIYHSIGLLCDRLPELFESNLDLLKKLFHDIGEETDTSIRASIQETLTNICNAYAHAHTSNMSEILEILLKNARESAPSNSRYLASLYANRLFPFCNVQARFINILGCGSLNSNVVSESRRGLKPYLPGDANLRKMTLKAYWPDFKNFVHFVTTQSKKNTEKKIRQTVFPPELYVTFLEFSTEILKNQSHSTTGETVTTYEGTAEPGDGGGGDGGGGDGDGGGGGHGGDTDESTKQWITDHWGSPTTDESHPVLEYIGDFLEEALDRDKPLTPAVRTAALESLLSVFLYCPTVLGTVRVRRLLRLLVDLLHVPGAAHANTKELVGNAAGLITAADRECREQLLKDLIEALKDEKKKEDNLGAIYGLGYIISHSLAREITIPPAYLETSVLSLVSLLHSKNLPIRVAACHTLGLLGRYRPLPLEDGEEGLKESEEKGEGKPTKRSILKEISSLCNPTQKEEIIIERTAMALANLCLGDPSSFLSKGACETLTSLATYKDIEIHFMVGEALSVATAGWISSAARNKYFELVIKDEERMDVETNRTTQAEDEPMKSTLQKILREYLFSDRQDTRPAASLWLLSLVKHAYRHPVISRNLAAIQRGFSALLSDNNEVVQEVAGKGLVEVYDKGDSKTKKLLVEDLVQTMSSGKSDLKMTRDSELFPPGMLGQNSGGKNLTTMKDLLDMAEDLNDSSLVYKFLNLASHHVIWNSKRGAAFTARALASRGGTEAFKKHIEKIVPKLFRSSYDPAYQVAHAMNNILSSLADRKEIHESYFDPIIRDCLSHMWDSQWRTRQASCLALSDVLVGKTMDQVRPYLLELWEKTFRVLDDNKETVRNAASNCLKTVGGITVRLCDPNHTSASQGKEAMELVIPFLCKKGIVSEVAEVRLQTIELLQKIAKVAQHLLQPHVPLLVVTILEGLSNLEPAQFNYLQVHAEKMGVSAELESARLAVSKLSPLNDTLELCMEQVDQDNFKELASVILELLGNSVGLATRVGAALFTIQLSIHKPKLLKPFLKKFILKLRRSVSGKSPAVRQAYAQCMGYLCKIASQKEVDDLINHFLDIYQKSDQQEEEGTRMMVGEALLQLIRAAPDRLQPLYEKVIPLVYFARCDADSKIKKVYEDLWLECGASLGLYVPGIISQIAAGVASSSWPTKAQAARALIALTGAVETAQLVPHFDHLLEEDLLKNLRGRIFPGKENLLEAISEFVKTCKSYFCNHPDGDLARRQASRVVSHLLAECKKTKREYRRQALISLADILTTLHDAFPVAPYFDAFEEVYPVVAGVLRDDTPETGSGPEDDPRKEGDEERAEKKKQEALRISVKTAAATAIGSAWPRTEATRKAHMTDVVHLLTDAAANVGNPWNLRVAVLKSLALVVRGSAPLAVADGGAVPEEVRLVLVAVKVNLEDANSTAVRAMALNTLGALVEDAVNVTWLAPLVMELLVMLEEVEKKFPGKHLEISKISETLKKSI